MLRNYPHAEDFRATAGGDSVALRSGMAKPVAWHAGTPMGQSPSSPPGEGKYNVQRGRRKYLNQAGRDLLGHGVPFATAEEDQQNQNYPQDQIENIASRAGYPDDEDEPNAADIDFLQLVREAEDQALLYVSQVNRKAWSQTYRAYHNEHFFGSKYTRPDWRARSKIFRPKTRSAVRKDSAAVAASLFNNIDAVNCLPGNESDVRQRGAAAVMESLVNYRTDRASGRAAMPWFQVAMGARQDAVLTGVCLSKQYWKTEYRKLDQLKRVDVQMSDGTTQTRTREQWMLDIDRPDSILIPPENYVIDPAADWTNPSQSAQYIIIKWPMQIEEVVSKQNAPVNPWHMTSEDALRTSVESGKFDMAAIRRARELGLDRLDETQTGMRFQICWVYEVFMKVEGEDWTFLSLGDREYLTDPKPVRKVYPEQFGERPLSLGYGSLESHRIYPMGPAESWQQYQQELNDIANLQLDSIKQNVMPVTKIVRGKMIDIDQVKRRSSGSAIIVTNKDDVTWDRPPDVPQSVPVITRNLELEFDDLAGQFNGQTTQDSNALARTLGGLKLVAGSANAVQELDIRIWIETWAAPALAQIVRLEQYYESDPTILGIAGDRAQLFQKYGINQIDDAFLEQEITIRVSVGLGAGDPQQRLMKFQAAIQVAMPLLSQSKEFQSGEYTIDVDAVMEEVFGAAGYRDGGARFVKRGQPQPNPMGDLQAKEVESKIQKNLQSGKGALLTGLAKAAQVELGKKQLEADTVDMLLGHQRDAHEAGLDRGHRHNEQILSAMGEGHKQGMAILEHRHNVRAHHAQREDAYHQQLRAAASAAAAPGDEEGDGGAASVAPPQTPPQRPPPQAPQMGAVPMSPMGASAPPGPPPALPSFLLRQLMAAPPQQPLPPVIPISGRRGAVLAQPRRGPTPASPDEQNLPPAWLLGGVPGTRAPGMMSPGQQNVMPPMPPAAGAGPMGGGGNY